MNKKTSWTVTVVLLVIIIVLGGMLWYSTQKQAQMAIEMNASSTQGAASTPVATDLAGESYWLASYGGTAVPTGENYTLNFSSDGTRLVAKVCNTMTGSYTVASGTLTGRLASTQMFCVTPLDAMPIENSLGSLLAGGATVSLSGTTLTLSSATTTMVFESSN